MQAPPAGPAGPFGGRVAVWGRVALDAPECVHGYGLPLDV